MGWREEKAKGGRSSELLYNELFKGQSFLFVSSVPFIAEALSCGERGEEEEESGVCITFEVEREEEGCPNQLLCSRKRGEFS